MKLKTKTRIIGAIAVLLLAQLACRFYRGEDQFTCVLSGGNWVTVERTDGLIYGWCEYPPEIETEEPVVPAPEPIQDSVEDQLPPCMAASDEFTWAYQDFASSTGTGGIACNANFTFTSLGIQPLYLVVYSTFDNGAMKSERWRTIPVAAGETWTERVNTTKYNDGSITYSRLELILVLNDSIRCSAFIPQGNEALWEQYSSTLELLSCP